MHRRRQRRKTQNQSLTGGYVSLIREDLFGFEQQLFCNPAIANIDKQITACCKTMTLRAAARRTTYAFLARHRRDRGDSGVQHLSSRQRQRKNIPRLAE